MKSFWPLVMLLLVVSCSSAKKRALELSEKERHEEAIEHWVAALKSDPDDEEVRDGFQRSLEIVSNDRLTRVRDKRLANNQTEALDELKSLIDLQQKYNLKMDFNSSTFQGREVQSLWPYYKMKIETNLNKKMPLAAEADQLFYKNVFSSLPGFEEVSKTVRTSGDARCQTLRQTGEAKPFYRSFVSQFCKYFNPGRDLSSVTISSVLFKKVNLTTQIQNVSDTSAGSLQTHLNKSLGTTPWFSAEGAKDINVKLNGTYSWSQSSEEVTQAHNYKVSIPYTDYKTVKVSRQIPYTSYENGKNVTRYRTEHVKEQQPVTKYRSEARVYHHLAIKKTQNLNLNVKGSIMIDRTSHPFSYLKTDKEERFLHDLSLPQIGLAPQKIDVSNPLEKFDQYSQDLSLQFQKDLLGIWEKSFCTLPSARDLASVGENTLRCKRLPTPPLAFVDGWFKTYFGVSSERASEILGHF